MPPTPNIRRFASREWATYKDLRLGALADSLEAFGRTLAEEQDRSDADWSRRLLLLGDYSGLDHSETKSVSIHEIRD